MKGFFIKNDYKDSNSFSVLSNKSKSPDDNAPNFFKIKDLSIEDIADLISEGFRSPAEA